MNLKPLNDLSEFSGDRRIKVRKDKFQELWGELEEMQLPGTITSFINSQVDHINSLENKGEVFKQLGQSQNAILKLLKDEMNLVPANYYRNLWVALGMAVFGIPLGVVFGLSFQNMAFIGIGIPIGLVIGIGIGVSMDNKARDRGNQLKFEA